MDKSSKLLAKNMAALMNSTRRSIADVNRGTRLSRTILSGYLRGAGASLKNLDRVADYFGVMAADLIREEEPPGNPIQNEAWALIREIPDDKVWAILTILRMLRDKK